MCNVMSEEVVHECYASFQDFNNEGSVLLAIHSLSLTIFSYSTKITCILTAKSSRGAACKGRIINPAVKFSLPPYDDYATHWIASSWPSWVSNQCFLPLWCFSAFLLGCFFFMFLIILTFSIYLRMITISDKHCSMETKRLFQYG